MVTADMTGLSNDTIGVIGVIALLVLVFAGLRVYIAASVVGLLGTVAIIGWDAGAGIIGTVPHSKSPIFPKASSCTAGASLSMAGNMRV